MKRFIVQMRSRLPESELLALVNDKLVDAIDASGVVGFDVVVLVDLKPELTQEEWHRQMKKTLGLEYMRTRWSPESPNVLGDK